MFERVADEAASTLGLAEGLGKFRGSFIDPTGKVDTKWGHTLKLKGLLLVGETKSGRLS